MPTRRLTEEGDATNNQQICLLRKRCKTNAAGEKKASSMPLNIAVEKDRLRSKLKVAESKFDKGGNGKDQDKAAGAGSIRANLSDGHQSYETRRVEQEEQG